MFSNSIMSEKLVPIVPIKKSGNTKQISPAKHWVFTLNNYKKQDILLLNNNSSIKRLSMQEEVGESGTPHLQGYIEFYLKKRPKGVFKSFNAHWEKCRNVKAAIVYTQKLDTRAGKIYLKGVRLHRPLKIYEPKYRWQKEIDNFVDTEPDDRTIHWIWSAKAGMGKTQLCKYLCARKQALLVSGAPGDMKYQIASAAHVPDIILMNLPKGCGPPCLKTLESIKDGLFGSPKYESSMVIMNSPHVFVFGNFEIKFGEDEDYDYDSRWRVCKVEGADTTLNLKESSSSTFSPVVLQQSGEAAVTES
ncbi:MAG: putative viral replication protein [Cressdnaviricota sp.]|nr:MAG: putative viral replication protein [Cressdnaviricota sp.]